MVRHATSTASFGSGTPSNELLSTSCLITQRIKDQPEKVACCEGKRQWTYADLDATSQAIERTLVAQGLHPGEEVPVFVGRCFESVATIVAFTRLAICFVPMDPDSWGQARVDAVCEAIQPKLVVFAAPTTLNATGFPTIKINDVLVHGMALKKYTIPGPVPEIDAKRSADQPIYIIFTSGTTGTPKGVVIPRRCVDNYVHRGSDQGMPFNLGVNSGDRVLLLFSMAFDAALGVLFSTLCWGGELVLSQPGTVLEDARTCTILPATPSLLATLGDPAPFKRVRAIFLGGESPSPVQVQLWSATHRRIFNCYGPTEATICASMAELRHNTPITLGYPMTDTRLLIMSNKDGHWNLADEGEICISGPGLAIGYYRNAPLTAERFFTWEGTRLYRTLDHGRITPDGIVFCGRQDSIVKNRGYLINMDVDVLPRLLDYRGVSAAATFMQDNQLMAAITPANIDTTTMRQFLVEKYEDFVVPDYIHACNELPRTTNGKVDLPILRFSMTDRFTRDSVSGMLQSRLGRLMCEAVAVSLGLPSETVPMDRSFWELGGNSLLAVRLLSELHRRGQDLTSEDLFIAMPLAALTQKLKPVGSSDVGASPTDLEKDRTAVRPPITLAQLGMIRSSIKYSGASYMLIKIDFTLDQSTSSDPSRMRHAWEMVLKRHTVFSTSFNLLAGVQQLEREEYFDWEEIRVDNDTGSMEAALKKASTQLWNSIRHEEDGDVFVPAHSLRFLLGEGIPQASLLWLIHHSLVDGWSMGIITQEVQKTLSGQELPPQKLQFHDVAIKLSQYIQDDYQKHGRTFWQDFLNPITDISPLNLPRPTMDTQSQTRYGVVNLDLIQNSALVEQISAVSNFTPATIFHAAWSILLSTYVSQDYAVFGTVFSGREIPLLGIDTVVGPLLNTCPFVIRTAGQTDKAKFLAEVHATMCLIRNHQWSATKALQENMPGSHARIMQTALFLEYDLPGFLQEGWKFDRTDRPEFELTLSIQRALEYEGLKLRVIYDYSLYAEGTIKRLSHHFQNLVLALLDARCMAVSHVRDRMLEPSEFLTLTSVSPSTLIEPYVGPSSLKEAFEMGVRQWPDAISIETRVRSMTYRELDRTANFLAHRISTRVGVGEAIGVVSDRSLDWLVVVLAVIKAGAIYVPLDTKLPQERMQIMLETAQARLTIFPNGETLQRHGGIFQPSLCAAEELAEWDSLSEVEQLRTVTQSSDIAYITFTSGSTGVPKGVRIDHRAVLSYLSYSPARMGARPGRRHAQMFSPGFDVNQAEIFGSLCYGATLVLAEPEDPFAHLARVHATMITPSFLSVCNPADFPQLDTILFAGEAVPQDLSDRWSGGTRTVYNSYGPCECTIGCLFKPLRPHEEVTLGRPIPRVGVYLLDKGSRPVPIGVPGEICLSGLQVASGYIGAGMESLSTTRFITDPFVPGYRMYRTGDCGIWTEAMELRFLGRFDHQVKVRGYRVELNEIENVIRSIGEAGVRRAAAVVQGDTIVAFVEPATVDLAAIHSGLRRRLPEYACPGRIVRLSSLPTMANQKLDRKYLQSYEATMDSLGKNDDCSKPNGKNPHDGMQQILVEAWRIAIDLPKGVVVDAESDFLALGGSSLSQIRVAQIVSRRLGMTIPLKFFLWNTNFSVLAEAITNYSHHGDTADMILEPCCPQDAWEKLQPPYNSVSPLEKEFVLLSLSSPTPQAFNVAAHLRLVGQVDILVLEKAAESVASMEPTLYSSFHVDTRNGAVQRGKSLYPCEIIRIDHPIADFNIDQWVNRPFDLVHGPLTRLVLYGGIRGEVTLVLVQHHAITDKTALKTFLQRLQHKYNHDIGVNDEGILAGRRRVPDYTAWAQWKTDCAHSRAEGANVDYWRTILDNAPYPIFKSSSDHKSWDGISKSLILSPKVSCSRSTGLFVAVVATALAEVQATKDMIIGIPYQDRSEPGTEQMLGVFLDRLPIRVKAMRTEISPSESFVKYVGTIVRDALSHAEPFRGICEIAKFSEDLQVMVVYNRHEDALSKAMSIPGVDVEDVEVHTTGAKFPLLVEFTEREDGSTVCDLECMENLVPLRLASAIAEGIETAWSLV